MITLKINLKTRSLLFITMGIITQGYHGADNCCTVCCMGGILMIGMIVAIPLEIISAPVTIPLRKQRNKKFSKALQVFYNGLCEEDKTMFLEEIGKTTLESIQQIDIVNYYHRLQKVDYTYDNSQRNKTKKMDKIPNYCKKNIIWCGIPEEETVVTDLKALFAEIKRQKSMTEIQQCEELYRDLKNTIATLSAIK